MRNLNVMGADLVTDTCWNMDVEQMWCIEELRPVLFVSLEVGACQRRGYLVLSGVAVLSRGCSMMLRPPLLERDPS